MSYLNLDEHYFDNIKVKRLAARLGHGAELLPLQLWCHAAHHFPEDGVFKNYTAEEIKAFCKWDGDCKIMLLALLELEFLLQVAEKTYKINDWEDHQGHIISFKIRGKKNAEKRWAIHNADKKHAISIADSNAGSYAPTYLPTIPTNTTAKKINAFKTPTEKEVKDYCDKHNYELDAEAYIAYNEARGWLLNGKNKMKSWKADVTFLVRKKLSYKNKQQEFPKGEKCRELTQSL